MPKFLDGTMVKAETLCGEHPPFAQNVEKRTCHWSKASRKDSPPPAGRGAGSTLKLPSLSLPAMLGGTCTHITHIALFQSAFREISLDPSSLATKQTS